MASSTFIITILVAIHLMFVPSISAYQGTTTYEDHDQHHCHDQMQHQSLSYCKQFLTHGSKYIVLQTRLGVMDRPEQQLQECCGQLRQVDESCRCKGLRHIVQEQAKKGELPRKEMHKFVMRAENLPEMCSLAHHRCHIGLGGNY
ncbi:2S sulfur-rich seed storage protein 1-like isoform X2 [Punica granatum]|uniref:Bifunctional inhibitor/plant lipid transfer protein/seed storage helical domain-containing protein n=2 Tax=Punica granatum TaxID=22663 RepID=A0A218XUV4_PUNGR|nr:2S sulfur-rich seed storage protein 1-like isoform X2 [Punica granatum]OWM88734.1 hypothetical protein CDL15_Pgr002501 [Punica granatum]PKI55885.1 hypothetical protein CRG98_023766 [Punica granatum]